MRTLALTVALAASTACLVALTACGTPAPDDTAAAPTPAASSPRPTPSGTPAPLDATLALPACATLFTADEIVALMGHGLEPQPDATNPGTSIPALQELIRSVESVSCTWILPESERGVVVSIVPADAALLATVRGNLSSTGFEPPSGGPFEFYSEQGSEDFVYTETHALGPDLWVCAFDGSGSNSRGIVQAVIDKLAVLNPGRY